MFAAGDICSTSEEKTANYADYAGMVAAANVKMLIYGILNWNKKGGGLRTLGTVHLPGCAACVVTYVTEKSQTSTNSKMQAKIKQQSQHLQ